MKVSIVGGGRSVEIECPDANVTIDTVGDKALALWRATDGPDSTGPAYGFQPAFSADPPRVVAFKHKPLTVNSEVTG